VRWVWTIEKNASNRQKHKLSFATAVLVFDDPLAMSRRDVYPHEERWQTVGLIGQVIVLVVHTLPEVDSRTGEEIGRIISARKATPQERRRYEEGDFE
jgi:uncharacterized DUF497 family protein